MAGFTYNATQPDGNSTAPDSVEFDPLTYCLIIAVIAALGVTGNCFNLVIYSSKSNRNDSLSVYIRALAVSDSLVLITTLTDDTISRLFGFHILYDDRAICPVVLFFTWFWPILSSTLLVSVAVDRYIAVAFPLKRASLCSFKRAIWTLIGIVMLCACITMPEIIWNEVVRISSDGPTYELTEYDCPYVDSLDHSLTMTIYSFLFILFLPFSVVLVLNIRAICILKASLNENAQHLTKSVSLARVTFPVIGVTVCSVLLLLPLLLVEIVEFAFQWVDVSPERQRDIDTAWDTTNVIRLLNYAMNFYFFIAFSKNHRTTLINAFGCLKNKEHEYAVSEREEKYTRNTAVTEFYDI